MSRVDVFTPSMVGRLTPYWATVYKRTWQGSMVSSFLLPFLYLAAMGVGLGSFVDANAGPSALDGVTYLEYIAPGLLAITAFQTAIGETTYPVMGGFKWHKFYYSMAATPLGVADIVAAQLVFVLFRILLTCGFFVLVLALYSAVGTWWQALLALAVTVLVGAAHGAPMIAVSSRLRSEAGFALVFRLGVLPMSLFSGAFFPIDQLPHAISWLAYLTPIWHGVNLCRSITLGLGDPWLMAVDAVYLIALVGVGWYYSVTGFAKRLAQ
jgi:lipooligosaccharide transport system permease protein